MVGGFLRVSVAFLAAVLAAQSTHGAIITVPTDLAFGDQYRLVFVTSTTRDGTAIPISTYNTFVNNVAQSVPELASLNTTWTAIGSTRDIDAKDNIGSFGIPIYNLGDTRVSDNEAGLWDGSLDSAVALTELGSAPASNVVWTGTLVNGTKDNFALGSTRPSIGFSSESSSSWISYENRDPSGTYHFYAISGTLAQVPGPSALWLSAMLSAAAGALTVYRLKLRPRRQKLDDAESQDPGAE
jgi:hypothetical protein